MKTKLATLTLAALLGTAGATAFAHEDYSEGAMYHNLSHITAGTGQSAANQSAPFGYAVSGEPDRHVTLDNGARYLNVTRLETIMIHAGGKSVTWKFDTLGTQAFPLSQVVPGLEGVTAYVAENPAYQGG